GPRTPAADPARACTRSQQLPPLPSKRPQTTSALPFGSTATSGLSAFCPAAESVSTGPSARAAERERARTRKQGAPEQSVVPSRLRQVTSALPPESIATWALSAS